MDIFKGAERLMRMDDATWARHANPWSGWSRIVTLPLIALSIWARTWFGGWVLLPIAALVAWNWLNPRAFPPPRDHDNWAARAVLGERWFLARARVDMPAHHRRMANILTACSAIGLPPLVWGLWTLDAGWTVAGLVLTIGPKMWFLDRMNWIVQDTTGSVPGTPLPNPKLPPKESTS